MTHAALPFSDLSAKLAPLHLAERDAEHFGLRLRQIRKEKRMTQQELAEHLGVSIPAISAWEKGRSLPRDHRLTALAELLDIPVTAFADTAIVDQLGELLDRSRRQIALALGIKPAQIRISIEL